MNAMNYGNVFRVDFLIQLNFQETLPLIYIIKTQAYEVSIIHKNYFFPLFFTAFLVPFFLLIKWSHDQKLRKKYLLIIFYSMIITSLLVHRDKNYHFLAFLGRAMVWRLGDLFRYALLILLQIYKPYYILDKDTILL